jgi:hypothetical protein
MDGWMDGWMDGIRRSATNHGLTQDGMGRNLVLCGKKNSVR